mmetsp:Transcript_90743/g.270854  ORF Transcript_90743/g.270854 Transcript_90743/m.270854 type:complete len:218 (+) Transcript_90743:87-740(+)|eukprot:CAMPEP_0175241512 /NCGR_PEP_ID=MMETSP0093-20121207/30599_1 /TAXON_ID=311494 /ORGANISM="Alexandrium monilatum, Strain CCMP3105" /LENGTH=217 /DNA_ID=CAMNT_0016535575 /DNA_START=61 /DNA_END=714 /DNA_ORIENTATION=+
MWGDNTGSYEGGKADLPGAEFGNQEVLPQGEEPSAGQLFRVELDRGVEMAKVGLSVYDGTPELAGLVTEVMQDSLLTGTFVRKFDKLMSVNGKSARDVERVFKVMRADRDLTLVFKRPKTYAIKVRKEAGLGLVLGFSETDEFLVIQKIEDGAVRRLNEEYTDREVRCFDVIVQVNSVTGSAENLIAELEDSDVITLGIMRWFTKADIPALLEEFAN